MTGLRDTTCHRQLRRLSGDVAWPVGDAAWPVDRTQHVAASSADFVGDVAWPVDDGWRSAPASRIVLLLAEGTTTATGVWLGVVATASTTAVSSWT
jgi:hypothetical protein